MKKRYRFEALLSFFIVGLGQVVKGDSNKGLKWLLWFYFGIPAILYATFLANIYFFIFIAAIMVIAYPLYWAYNIYDAWKCEVE